MSADEGNAATLARPSEPLMPHEVTLLEWLATGRSNAQIGHCMARSEKTVRNQLTRVYEKLGAANRTEAVALYLRQAKA